MSREPIQKETIDQPDETLNVLRTFVDVLRGNISNSYEVPPHFELTVRISQVTQSSVRNLNVRSQKCAYLRTVAVCRTSFSNVDVVRLLIIFYPRRRHALWFQFSPMKYANTSVNFGYFGPRAVCTCVGIVCFIKIITHTRVRRNRRVQRALPGISPISGGSSVRYV